MGLVLKTEAARVRPSLLDTVGKGLKGVELLGCDLLARDEGRHKALPSMGLVLKTEAARVRPSLLDTVGKGLKGVELLGCDLLARDEGRHK